MKLTDYLIDLLASNGVRRAYGVSGGASIHILHSLNAHPNVDFICPHHEQSAAMAADGEARLTGEVGCAFATSGPGATNLITGVAGAWFDSVPTLFITGQVTTFRMKSDTGVRQFGFQETDVLPMMAPITKYAVQLTDPADIRYEVEKCLHIALEGRRGPVLLDIPDDLQRAEVDPASLRGFDADARAVAAPSDDELDRLCTLMSEAERPVIALGWGVRLAGAAETAQAVMKKLGWPATASWAARDLVTGEETLFTGCFGTHGTRSGNFAVQNADFILAVGTRLSTRETGSPMSSWARGAKVAVVDIDKSELAKFDRFERPIDLAIQADAGAFLTALEARLNGQELRDITPWRDQIEDWRSRYAPCSPARRADPDIDPYAFMEALSAAMLQPEPIISDTGCSVAWLMQGYQPAPGQRVLHDFNNTAMGWALPAAIGGSLGLDRAPIICVVGDGSMMMNLQELATVAHLNLPIRIILLNNSGYAMVRQTETQWLESTNVGTSPESGLGFPDFVALAHSFGIPAEKLEKSSDTTDALRRTLAATGPSLLEVMIPPHHGVEPQAKFGYAIEDAEPLLPRQEFLANMLVEPMPKSLEPLDD